MPAAQTTDNTQPSGSKDRYIWAAHPAKPDNPLVVSGFVAQFNFGVASGDLFVWLMPGSEVPPEFMPDGTDSVNKTSPGFRFYYDNPQTRITLDGRASSDPAEIVGWLAGRSNAHVVMECLPAHTGGPYECRFVGAYSVTLTTGPALTRTERMSR